MLALPSSITIVEVSPRDGLQSLPQAVATATKIRMVDRLSEAGFATIEVTSFAHPRAVPNLADAEAVMTGISRRPGTIYRALVPNARGAARAVACGADEVLGLTTISRTYLHKNQNMTRETALAEAIRAFEITLAAGKRFVMALGMAFWCPYEGLIPEAQVHESVAHLHRAGVRAFYLAGSVGLEDPRHVGRLFSALRQHFPDARFGYHIHDRGGFAPANIVAALDAGVTWLEGALCGIGGGIAMPGTMGSLGNFATEDLINLMQASGISTGLELDAVLDAARDIASLLDIAPRSRAASGGTRAAAYTPAASPNAGGFAR